MNHAITLKSEFFSFFSGQYNGSIQKQISSTTVYNINKTYTQHYENCN